VLTQTAPRALPPPDFTLLLDPTLAHELTDKAARLRKTFHANLLTDSLESPLSALQ
jgi:hypothetical protein